MTALLAILCVVLIAVVFVQIGKVTELAAKIRGEEEAQERSYRTTSRGLLLFLILFLVGCVWSAIYYKNYMLGFGPHESASAHGSALDYMFKVTTFFTGIVFVLTQIALFYFAYKYRQRRGAKAAYMPHNNTLEVVWTVIPAVVMTFLVVGGLDAWNEVMADIDPEEDFIEIEAMGYQFAWNLRYPGPDGKLGKRDFRLTSGTNPVGQDWTDEAGLDDFHPSEMVLPKGKKVRVRIIARDVLHDFYLPHFRVKMDAVPGMPTYFVFTPEKTTEEYRQQLKEFPEYQVPDPENPDKQIWETFDYELACAELCGKGHYSMRRLVRIVEEEEYKAWLEQQQSLYMTSIHGTEADPWPIDGRLPAILANARKQEFLTKFETALKAEAPEERTFVLNHVNFETGSAKLTDLSKRYALAIVIEAMHQYPDLIIELGGHTDATGDADANMELSRQRAEAVFNYLTSNGIDPIRLRAVGYGQNKPIASNETEAGRAKNRRIEFTILSGGPAVQNAGGSLIDSES
ncbi:MAG: flagellar motor protein MotB [Bacteroidetes bacterium]|nr:MAG: flagellar motor protein MotB [Bacteroidota bacterium]